MWDQGSNGWTQGSEWLDLGSRITDHGIGIYSFLGIRDQAVPYLWDQGRKFVTLLESRIRNLRAKKGSAMKKHTSLPPCHKVLYRVKSPKEGAAQYVTLQE